MNYVQFWSHTSWETNDETKTDEKEKEKKKLWRELQSFLR